MLMKQEIMENFTSFTLKNVVPMQNHLWNQKMSRLRPHKWARIMGPCQYVYEKKVLARSVRCLIQMRSGGAVSPSKGPRLVSGGGKGTKSQESPKILHFALPKMVINSKLSDDGSRTFNPSVINQVL